MTAAENRRRLAALRSTEREPKGNQAMTLHNSAELLYAARMSPGLTGRGAAPTIAGGWRSREVQGRWGNRTERMGRP